MSGPRRDRPFLRLAVSAADVADDQYLQKALAEIAGQKHPSVIINTHPKDGCTTLMEELNQILTASVIDFATTTISQSMLRRLKPF